MKTSPLRISTLRENVSLALAVPDAASGTVVEAFAVVAFGNSCPLSAWLKNVATEAFERASPLF
jgi:hypothetical protein